MPRQYSVVFEQVSVSAPQDLVQVVGAAGKSVKIKRVWWGATDTTLPTAQMMSTRCRFLPAVVVNGSGGTTPSFLPFDPGDAAASVTALVNNTTKATTSGTAVKLDEHGDHIYSGYDYTFPYPPTIGPTESFVFELLSTPAGTVHLSGGCVVEEQGG